MPASGWGRRLFRDGADKHLATEVRRLGRPLDEAELASLHAALQQFNQKIAIEHVRARITLLIKKQYDDVVERDAAPQFDFTNMVFRWRQSEVALLRDLFAKMQQRYAATLTVDVLKTINDKRRVERLPLATEKQIHNKWQTSLAGRVLLGCRCGGVPRRCNVTENENG